MAPRALGRWRCTPLVLVATTAAALAGAAASEAERGAVDSQGTSVTGGLTISVSDAEEDEVAAQVAPQDPAADLVECDTSNDTGGSEAGNGTRPAGYSFDYHKPAFPLDWRHDGATIALAAVGLMIAASGGIGGGGILVPLYMLVLGFRPKHAIALSNFTILGGAIANTALNARKRHPILNKQLIDWDLILIMEPLTIFGAVVGSLMSKVLPNLILTVSLVGVLSFMGQRTLKKGLKMWAEESRRRVGVEGSRSPVEMLAPGTGESPAGGVSVPAAGNGVRAIALKPTGGPETPSTDDSGGSDLSYLELQSDADSCEPDELAVGWKIGALSVCFAGTCVMTVLKGGGKFPSPLGFPCGSLGFWALYFVSTPWVLAFAAAFRWLLVGEFQRKVRRGYVFVKGEVQWDPWNTLKYPAYCAVSGLLAGLFGVGGGIVKGPLMLEMGVIPSVASASAAAMILFTSAAASTSFVVFSLLHATYGAIFFTLGLVSTAVGQYVVGKLVDKHKRQSPIVLSIGSVIVLSSLLVAVNTVASLLGPSPEELLRPHGVCSSDV